MKAVPDNMGLSDALATCINVFPQEVIQEVGVQEGKAVGCVEDMKEFPIDLFRN